MIRSLSLSVAIVFLAGAAELKAAEPAAKAVVETKDIGEVWRDARVIHDLAAFDISTLNSKTTGAWIVAKILPGGLSGTGFFEKESGLVILVGGQWERIELLSGKSPRQGRYQWKQPSPNPFDRNLSMMDLSSVFMDTKKDATVICQFFKKKTGAQQFSSVTLIPDDWKTLVKPAHKYYVQHAADFTGKDSSKLRKLAMDDNPLIGLAALRRIPISATEEKEIDALVDLVRGLPKYRQAAFILGLLKNNDDHSRNIVFRAIARAKNSSELTGMALGIYTSLLVRGQISDPRKNLKCFPSSWRSRKVLIPLPTTKNP